ncbi:MAG TPA: hypothetical protein VLE53_07980, partial [Gemmatimonadaceae bacterium]|nr:hypothetical protein [Gemmatimonadaceae bacterium]
DRSRPEPFLLDGQAVVLEDYLAIRPERASDLSARLRTGALEAGPWYVLGDELLPSGEALVRNLLAGRRVLRSLRASPPAVLYCPDSFGHPAALPAIASGFGCPLIVLWRGYGGPRWPDGDTARWHAPDGSGVLLYHLPPDGYETGSHLPADRDRGAGRWASLRATLAPRATTGLALLTAGADHHAPSCDWEAQVDALATAMGEDRLVRSSLERFRAALEECAAARPLPGVAGELRDSYGYTWTLQGTHGVRASLKRRNAQVERLLVRDTEPWVALASRRDGRARRALLDAAWRCVLLCHPHDTLCGCSIDAVAASMATRMDDAASAASALRDDAIESLLGHDAATARDRAAEWEPVVVVRNRAARPRSGVAILEVDVVLADVAVGPGSAGIPVTPRRPGRLSLGAPAALVQEVSRARHLVREESSRHYPRTRLVERRRLLARVDAVPALGMRVIPVREGRRAPAVSDGAAVRATTGLIENEYVRVRVADGGVTLESGDRVIPHWLAFEAEGERGDLYTHSVVPDSRVEARLQRARVTAQGPLRAELTVHWDLRVPARRMRRETGEPYRVPAATIPLRTVLQLDEGAAFVRVLLSGEQRTSDARLRARFRTDVREPHVVADAAFGPVSRAPLHVPADVTMERPAATAPLHRYVSAFDPWRGATLFSDGLTEYEVTPDAVIAVTVVRSVGELSRHDLPERPGHAGYPAETPLAQERGPLAAGFAMMLHGPRSAACVDAIERTADDVLLPLEGCPWRTAIAPPDDVAGVELVGAGLACSAIKPAEDGAWTILRCVNLLDTAVRGAWKMRGVVEARLARLDETPLGALAVETGRVAFEAPPRGIVTILVR